MKPLHVSRALKAYALTGWQGFRRLVGTDPNRGAKWASPLQKHRLLHPKNTGFLLDGANAVLSLKDSFKNVATIGTVGTGKTAIGAIPSIKRPNECSKVILDIKGTTYQQTATTLHDQGYKIEVLDLIQLNGHGIQYKPFSARTGILERFAVR